MANLQGEFKWSPVRILETFELARGGINGNMNEQAKALLDRSEYLNNIKANKGDIIQGQYSFNSTNEFNLVKNTLPKNSSILIADIGLHVWDGVTLKKSSYDPSIISNQYTDSFSSLTKNSTTLFPFSSLPRNSLDMSMVGGHISFLQNYVLSIDISGAEVDKFYRIQQVSNPTQENTPNRWIFEILNRSEFESKDTLVKTITVIFPIVANKGIQTFTVQEQDLFISVTVDTNKIPVGNFYSVTPENYSYTYIIDPSCYGYSSVKQLNISEINEKITKITKPQQLQNLLSDLRNPIQSVCINLIGDSITWGLGASDIGATLPNNKNINDIRNNATSRTWANIFRDYLGTSFCTSQRYGDSSITKDGTAYFENLGTATLSTELEFFKFRNNVSGKEFTKNEAENLVAYHSSTSSGSYIDLVTSLLTSVSQTRPTELSFEFVGESLTINYAKLAFGDENSANVNIYVNDNLHSTFSVYSNQAAFGQKFILNDLPYGKNKIKIENVGTVAGVVVRITSITATKKVTVINNGLSGSSTKTWIDNNVVKDAVSAKDNYLFIQLGTNDRHQTAKLGDYKKQYLIILNQILSINPNVHIILMSPSAVTQNEEPSETVYKFRIVDVNEVVSQIAKKLNYSFISNFEKTNLLKSKGTIFLSDNLHPNNLGHEYIAENIINSLIGSWS